MAEYLLSLTTGMEPVPDPTKAAFVLNIAEEVPGSHLFLRDFNQMEHIFLAGDQLLEDNGSVVPTLATSSTPHHGDWLGHCRQSV